MATHSDNQLKVCSLCFGIIISVHPFGIVNYNFGTTVHIQLFFFTFCSMLKKNFN